MPADHSADYDLLDQLAEEFAERYRKGERPSLKEYIDRYPHLAEDIREILPAMVEMEQVEEDRQDQIEPEKPTPPPSLDRVGDFKILREIGRGGMGIVYEAVQESLGRHVALKILPLQASRDGKALERFRREARSAAKLHHTNIVPVFEVGQDSDVCFYAMQFIQGQGLDQVVEELSNLRSLSMAGRRGRNGSVSSGPKSAAHPQRKGISQLTQSLLTGAFKRADLDKSSEPSEHEAVTLAPETPVTPSSSEQQVANNTSGVLPGEIELKSVDTDYRHYFISVARIGHQTANGLAYAHTRGIVHRDIKPSNLLLDAAGVVWITDFGLAKSDDDGLTGTGDLLGTLRYMAPERFQGVNDARGDLYALGLTLYEMLVLRPAFDAQDRLKLIEQVRSREPVRPRQVDSRIPRDLETIVLKAIDKEPARRYQTAQELSEDLRCFIDDEPIRARQAGRWERCWRWMRRHPAYTGMMAASFIAVLAIIGVFFVWNYNQQLKEAFAKASKAEWEARKAEKIAHEMRLEAETARNELRVMLDHEVFAQGALQLETRKWQDAVDSFTRYLQNHPKKVEALAGRGKAYAQWGKPNDAVRDFDATIALDADHLDAHLGRGGEYAKLEKVDKSIADFDRAFDMTKRMPPNYARQYSQVLFKKVEPKWTILRPMKNSLQAQSGATMQLESDGSIYVSGSETTGDEKYTIEVKTNLRRITAIRLEAMTDKRLPKGGPGRYSDGSFGLSEVSVYPLDESDQPDPVPMAYARDDSAVANVYSSYPISRAIDKNLSSYYRPYQRYGTAAEPVNLVFVFATPIANKNGRIRIVLDSTRYLYKRHLGRFRLSITTQPYLLAWEKFAAEITRNGREWTSLAAALYRNKKYQAAWKAFNYSSESYENQTPYSTSNADRPIEFLWLRAMIQLKMQKELDALKNFEAVEAWITQNKQRIGSRERLLALLFAKNRLQADPADVALRQDLAKRYLDAGYYREAIGEYTALLGEDAKIYLDRGKCFALLGEAEKAAQDFEAALKLANNPFGGQTLTPVDIRNLLREEVDKHESQNHFDAAIVYLNTLLKTAEKDSERTRIFEQRAALFGKNKNHAEAVNDYTSAIKRSEGNAKPELYLERGRMQYWCSKAKEAQADFAEALRLNEDLSRDWLTKAIADLDKTRSWAAQISYLNPLVAIEKDTNRRARYLAKRASCYARIEKHEDARRDYSKAFASLDAGLAEYAEAYADLLWQDVGESKRLQTKIREALTVMPSIHPWTKLGGAFFAKGDLPRALAALTMKTERPEPSAENYLLSALVLNAMDDFPHSKQMYAKAIDAMLKFDAVAFSSKSFKGELTSKDSFDKLRNGCFAKQHTVHLYDGLTYTIDLLGNYDPYLRIEDDQGKNLAQDDDGGVGLNSRITFRPAKTGSYRIIATSCSSGRTGQYELKVKTQAEAKMASNLRLRLAISALSDYMQREPNNPSHWHARARWRTRLNLKNEVSVEQPALADFAKAIELGATYEMYLDRGELIALTDERTKAVPDFKEAMKLNAGESRKWLTAKAEEHEKLRNWNVSLACLDVLIEFEKEKDNLADFFMRRGQVWTELSFHKHALDDLERAVQNGKEGWEIKAWRGECFALLDELDKAAVDLREASKLNSIEATPWMVRKASDYEGKRRWPVVATFLHVVINAERNPVKEHGYRVRRGNALMHMERHQEAVAEFSRALVLKRNDVESLLMRAQCYAALKEHRKSATDLQEALHRDRTAALQTLQRKAYESERDGDFAATVIYLTPVIQSYDGHSNQRGFLLRRGRAYQMLDQLKEATADFRKLNQVEAGYTYQTNVAKHLVEIGERYAQRGNDKEASLTFEEARTIYETLLSGRPHQYVAGDYADFLLSRQAKWQVLEPQSFSAKNGTKFEKPLPDHSLLTEGDGPDTDVYTVTFQTALKGIRAIRLEALPHPSLPMGGPGRHKNNGNFHMHEVTLSVRSLDKKNESKTIEFHTGFGDHGQHSENIPHFPRNVVDGNPYTYWAILPERSRAHWAVLVPQQPFGNGGKTEITLKLHFNETRWKQHTLGRFRVSVTTDAKTVEIAELRSLMQRAKRQPSHVQANGWSQLAAAYAYCGEKAKALDAMDKAEKVQQQYGGRTQLMNTLADAHLGNREKVATALASSKFVLHENTHERDWYMTIRSMIPSVFLAQNPDDALFLSHRGVAHLRNGDLEKASRDYERLWKLEKLPASEFEARFYADFLLSKNTNWRTLEPVEMKSKKGNSLITLQDRSILAVDSILDTEKNVDDDTYVITAKADVKNVRYLLLEALPHRSLPAGGPGQASNGNFHLNVFSVSLEPGDDKGRSIPLTLVDGVVSFSETWSDTGVDVLKVAGLDGLGKATGRWSVYPKIGRPQWLMFRLKEPVNLTKNAVLRFTMNFETKSDRHNLGRFRLSVASDPKAHEHRHDNRRISFPF